MHTLTIKVIDAKALKLLEDLEALNLIEVLKSSVSKEKGQKLSAEMLGSITAEEAAQMRNELNEMRGEWDRDI